MIILSPHAVPLAAMPGRLEFPGHSMTAIVRATVALAPGGSAALLEDQPPHSGDVPEPDPDAPAPSMPPRYPSDFALHKPAADVLVAGHAHAPGGRPVAELRAGFRIGGIHRRLLISGDRRWQSGLMSSELSNPTAFESMPLTAERAFGGRGFAANPVGRGLEPRTLEDGSRARLAPNVELADDLVERRSSRPRPALLGPIPADWRERRRLRGRYGRGWAKKRWPALPADFDFAYFNVAPPEQRVEGYLRGDEELVFEHMHPEHAEYRTRLPGLRARVLVRDESVPRDRRDREIQMRLDTLWVDMDAEQAVLVWRGVTPVRDEYFEELTHACVLLDEIDRPRSFESCVAAFERLIAVHASGGEEEVDEPEPEPEPAEASSGPVDEELSGPEEAPGLDLEEDLDSIPDLELDDAALASLDPSIREQLLAAMEAIKAEEEEPEEPEPEPDGWTRRRVEHAALEGQSLAGEDLQGLDLSGLALDGMDLSEAILHATDLSLASLRGAALASCDLTGARLEETDLSGADLTRADLTGAAAGRAILAAATLREAMLEGAVLTGADLSGATCGGTDFASADLRGALLADAELASCVFEGATLDEADLSRASLAEATLEGASAAGARLDRAVLSGLRADGLSAPGASLYNVGGVGASLVGAVLDDADLRFSDLAGASFEKASLARADLSACVLRGTGFLKAALVGAKLVRADLFEAHLEKADLTQADLRGASLFGAETLDATIDGTVLEVTNLRRTKLQGMSR